MIRDDAGPAVLLLDGSPSGVACRLVVGRRGLLFRPVDDGPAPGDTPDDPGWSGQKLVPWSTLVGFDADASAVAPDGSLLQVLEVRGDHGVLRLLATAGSVSGLLADVRRHSARWDRCRRIPEPSVARPARLAAAGVAGAGTRAAAAAGVAIAAAGTAAARGVATALTAAARVLAPAGRRAARLTLPARRTVARSIVWLALAAAAHQVAAAAHQLAAAARRALATLAPVLHPPAAPGQTSRRTRPLASALAAVAVALAALAALVVVGPIASGAPQPPAPPAVSHSRHLDTSSMGRIAASLRALMTKPLNLPPATTAPVPAPPSLANAAPLSPHEVFGFAPYWELPVSGGYAVAGLTTIAYFSIGVNPDGSLDESGDGWVGYQSQALADLVTRAHAAGDRVVLTVNCFDQKALDQLTSSPTAPATLSAALVSAVEAKSLDGVNLDFEGTGSADQAGLTNLVSHVSTALHQVDPHWQVTMDTYASSAGDPSGFYDVAALAPWVDGFFVMSYQLNLAATPSAGSPLTSTMFSDLTTAEQYAAAVPPGKVILGLPYFGYDWPTTDGTMAAQATGGAVPITYGQVVASGHPIYWDGVTDTAWTSYQVGSQWHESYFEDPTSLYLVAVMSQLFHFAGVGAWALGMDGNDPAMLGALDGFAPATKDLATGPLSTTTSPPAGPAAAPGQPTTTTGPPTTTTPTGPTGTTTPGAPTTTGGTGSGTTGSGTTGSGTTGNGTTTTLHYSGTFLGQAVTLAPVTAQTPAPGAPAQQLTGPLTGFQTDDPQFTCLMSEPSLRVWSITGSSTQDEVVADRSTGDCATGSFVFTVPAGASPQGATTTSTT